MTDHTATILALLESGAHLTFIADKYAAALRADRNDRERPRWGEINTAIVRKHTAEGLAVVRLRADLICQRLIIPAPVSPRYAGSALQ